MKFKIYQKNLSEQWKILEVKIVIDFGEEK